MTAKNEGNASGNLDRTTSSKTGDLIIQHLDRGGDEMASDMSFCLNVFLCFVALMILYGYYVLFGYVFLLAMTELGDDLNWAFFGAMVSVGGGMAGGVAYSMKSQQVGPWTPLAPGDARRNRDPRGKCCGFQIY